MSAATQGFAIRVTVADTWQLHELDVTPDQTVTTIKSRALAASSVPADWQSRYEVKFGGAPVRDETRTLGSLGVKQGSALIILARRRRAVR